jgi:hypothetical protein
MRRRRGGSMDFGGWLIGEREDGKSDWMCCAVNSRHTCWGLGLRKKVSHLIDTKRILTIGMKTHFHHGCDATIPIQHRYNSHSLHSRPSDVEI